MTFKKIINNKEISVNNIEHFVLIGEDTLPRFSLYKTFFKKFIYKISVYLYDKKKDSFIEAVVFDPEKNFGIIHLSDKWFETWFENNNVIFKDNDKKGLFSCPEDFLKKKLYDKNVVYSKFDEIYSKLNKLHLVCNDLF